MQFGIEPIYWVLINSVVSFAFLFIISKILGKKQIAQLEFIDYVVGISLGSIAAGMATDSDVPFYYYLIAMAIFLLLAIFIDIVGRKCTFLKRLAKGKPVAVIYEGKIIYEQLEKSKIDVNDLLSMLRQKGFFDIEDVAYAIFETSGKLSVLPKGNQRPVVAEDIGEDKIKKASLSNVLVVDGEISYSGLNEANKKDDWLFDRLNINSKDDLDDILLVTYDSEKDKLNVHKKDNN